ncbi:MAG: aminopeptidase P family N-terminal domain-containing protein [Clostridia bacterium]|nr:aminopeptidase P family N-terminal domain-containing protein [Clostridia bacterium]
MTVRLVEVEFPEPMAPMEVPAIAKSVYDDRIKRAVGAMQERGLSHLVVYADREHFANMHFLTGYDPRFEEALLVISPGNRPALFVGNEGMAYASISEVEMDVALCQSFSLMGQPRGKSPSLKQMLNDAGIASGARVGMVGSKYYGPREVDDPEHATDVPGLIVDILRSLAGYENVVNAADMFTNPVNGLRVCLNVDDIAFFEYGAEVVYSGVNRVLKGLREGISALEASALFGYAGYPPLSCHLTMSFGERAMLGLASPSPGNKLKIGDFVNFGYGVWGANMARSGFAVENKDQLASETTGVVEDLYIPYFKMMARWYSSLAVGKAAGEVYEAVKDFVEDQQYGVALNPGHLIHLDEWPHSPFSPGSTCELRSGMAMQCDIISSTGAPYYGVHVEDGLVLADAALRAELISRYPATAERMQQRRRRFTETLGIRLSEDVLLMSSIQGVLSPYMLRPELALGLQL